MSKWKHAGYILPLVIAFAAFVFIPFEALASEGHGGPRWGDFGWRVLNFVIFAGILWYFVGGLAKRFFKNRRETISGALDDLDERRAKAKEQLAAVESRIARLNEEREAILAESRKQAENLKAGIVEEAHRQAAQTGFGPAQRVFAAIGHEQGARAQDARRPPCGQAGEVGVDDGVLDLG